MTYRKKLIEVSLPLEAINKESAREKSIRHGHLYPKVKIHLHPPAPSPLMGEGEPIQNLFPSPALGEGLGVRVNDWLITQFLIHALDRHGEQGAGILLSKVGDRGEIARDLAYRLYNLCDRKGWTQEAIIYSLVIAWSEISRLASDIQRSTPVQGTLEI